MTTAVRKIGLNGKTYYGTAGTTASTEMDIIKDASLTLASDDIKVGDRGSRWKSTETGQIEATLELTISSVTSHAGYRALMNAQLDGSAVAIKSLDKASGEGIDADFKVINRGEDQPLNGEIVVTFTLGVHTGLREPSWVAA